MGPRGVARWPDVRAVVACSSLAAVAVAIDEYFSAQEGYLSRFPDYDGVGYMVFARTVYQLLHGFHVHTALSHLLTIAPGWTAALALQFVIFGAGPLQAFTVRFWPVALILVLVYWIVRRRAPRSWAIAATVLTAFLPILSASIRSSSLEYFTGQASYSENWGLDDLRPDLLAAALMLWAVAILAEHVDEPTRATYLVSAIFAAAAVLVKPSTSPLLLLVWAGTLTVVWFVNRKRQGTLRGIALGASLFALLLAPWAVTSAGISSVVGYLYETAVTYGGVYATADSVPQRFAYFAVRFPTDLGRLEVWVVIAGALLVTVALVLRRLGPAEFIYGAVTLGVYATYALASARNAHLAEWISAALWIYVCAGVARLAAARWPSPRPRVAPILLAGVALYSVLVCSLGAFALANWPANEQRSNAQLAALTESLAGELGRHITAGDCFSYAPGPGWSASIQFDLTDANGNYPSSPPLNPSLSTADYLQQVRQCAAIITYREDMNEVAKAFYAPPTYQPYLRAVADWMHSPNSGYTLDRTWPLTNLVPDEDHTLGRFDGVSLTVELYLRSTAQG
jgi:hypothetical protein